MKRYYSLYQNLEKKTADIYIYGDITKWDWDESDVSSYNLTKELELLDAGIENINVFINSYGGDVGEGLAIYNALKRHSAKVITYADGFACSIASVIFSAGEERVITDTSLLMIHNAWTWGVGNASELKKLAEDLEKINQASVNAYMAIVSIEEQELIDLMDKETWISGQEAVEMGFATKLLKDEKDDAVNQSAMSKIAERLQAKPVIESKIEINIDELVEKIYSKLSEEKQLNIPQDEPINKPLNMMKAFFNVKEND